MAALTTMRMAPRSQAVESYLRNFERERQRLQEVLEVTLCYGIFCLSQNFSLKGMSVEELRDVTKYEAVKKRDFFVRNAGISSRRGHLDGVELSSSATQQLHVKPSHSWRDGNEDAEILKPAPRDFQGDQQFVERSTSQLLLENHSLPAEKKPFNEIDFFTKLFGKQFIDTAWATFAGRTGSQITSKAVLDERFTRIDQHKVVGRFPPLELPVTSFAEFLDEYVKVCVGQHYQLVAGVENRDNEQDGDSESPFPHKNENGDARSTEATLRQRAIAGSLRTRKHGADDAQPVTVSRKVPASDQSKTVRPKSLQHVQSKIKPELDVRREKLLRVKKTQTQLMKESLARARLAEYEAKRKLDAAGSSGNSNSVLQQQKTRKMPLSGITTGAAALEIADDFMKSPLMDSFSGKENQGDQNRQNTSSAKDPLREELYGTVALDDSFLGCKPPPPAASVNRKPQPKKPSRAYNGWLGDFGPLHTKTVVSEWGTPVDDDDAESDGANDAPARMQSHRSPSKKFEWKFDGTGPKSSKRGKQRNPSEDDFSSVHSDKENRLSDDDDGFSDGGLSEVSDPIFKWLKRAV